MNRPEDRRSEYRMDNKTVIFVEVCSASPEHNNKTDVILCTSLDISPSGIQVQMDKEVPMGSIIRLCADFGNERDPIYLIGETRWIKTEEDLFNIGFELLDAENSDISEWQDLVQEKLQNNGRL